MTLLPQILSENIYLLFQLTISSSLSLDSVMAAVVGRDSVNAGPGRVRVKAGPTEDEEEEGGDTISTNCRVFGVAPTTNRLASAC